MAVEVARLESGRLQSRMLRDQLGGGFGRVERLDRAFDRAVLGAVVRDEGGAFGERAPAQEIPLAGQSAVHPDGDRVRPREGGGAFEGRAGDHHRGLRDRAGAEGLGDPLVHGVAQAEVVGLQDETRAAQARAPAATGTVPSIATRWRTRRSS